VKSIEYDLRFLQAGLEVLENYLLADDLFWSLGLHPAPGEPDYPQLTPGWLLLTRARLVGREFPAGLSHQVQEASRDLDRLRTKWRVAWEKKAGQDYQARARMWRDFLQEYQENPSDHADRYSYEVRLRVMLELLRGDYHPQKSAEAELLAGLDAYLKSVLVAGEFIWEGEVARGFPRERFWFLYGTLSRTVGRD
jgi:hypothetical protein